MSTRRKRTRPQRARSSDTMDTPNVKRTTRSSARLLRNQQSQAVQLQATSSTVSSPMQPPSPPSVEGDSSDMFGEDMDVDPDLIAAAMGKDNDWSIAMKENYALSPRRRHTIPPSRAPAVEISYGIEGWKKDYRICWNYGDAADSIKFELGYEDIDGRSVQMRLEIVFQGLKTYPASYQLIIIADDEMPSRAETTFSRFLDIYDLEISSLVEIFVASLQGDDDASDDEEWFEQPTRGLETAKGSAEDLGDKWSIVKETHESLGLLGLSQQTKLLTSDKPPLGAVVAATRGQGGLTPFYLSDPLLGYLKSFNRCFHLKTSFKLNWATADRIGMDEDSSRQVFNQSHHPKSEGPPDNDDPVAHGLQGNIQLFSIPSLRPYVCNKDLCLYSMMSLGLGPSVEHIILTHPAVVDVLLSFAHSAASSSARMDLPLKLHIEVLPQFGLPKATLLDDLPNQRQALVWLIDQLPKVSKIKAQLEKGIKLAKIDTPTGSIAILRWVVGSCRAYLKETKPEEGIMGADRTGYTCLKQFTFVVGSPEQESNFRSEIVAAQEKDKNCRQYPTLLAFHASTSMSGYARPTGTQRANADFTLSKAVAVVELGRWCSMRILDPPPQPAAIKLFKPTMTTRMKQVELLPPPSETSVVASKALGKEYKTLIGAQEGGKLPFYIDTNIDSLYCWLLELHDFPESLLRSDLKKRNVPSIIAELRFPASFPHSPPFMRILHPRCLPFVQGGGGNITAGGSVCNEILTASGWNPAFCVEAIVRDVMVNMTEATPPARLDSRAWDRPYTMREAVEAYKRVAGQHGWQIPKHFDKLSK
ncbi:hypothetical protein IAR55_001963 [Kwoniella newhampshirensis]|uniref:UBC core domain-containing protein n=1 Tax=Kwoniella newhampshirensis TaxID=1651941 RepID=A0AAW0Z3P5_9TREE